MALDSIIDQRLSTASPREDPVYLRLFVNFETYYLTLVRK